MEKDKVFLDTPPFMKRKRKKTIKVDSCCAMLLKHLWENGIDTLYHCCGHSFEGPYLVMARGCTETDQEIKKLIKQVDGRKWKIY